MARIYIGILHVVRNHFWRFYQQKLSIVGGKFISGKIKNRDFISYFLSQKCIFNYFQYKYSINYSANYVLSL